MRINKFEFSAFDSEGGQTSFASLDWSDDKAKALQISEEELIAREKAGMERGYVQGREEGFQAAKAEEKENLNVIAAAMNALQTQLAAANHEFMKMLGSESQNAMKLAAVIARKIIGDIPEDALSKIAEREVVKAVAMLSGIPRLSVVVHPESGKALSSRLGEIKATAGFDGEIAIRPDETLLPQDVKIVWQSGRIERTSEKLWHEIEKALGVEIPPAPPPEEPVVIEAQPSAIPQEPEAAGAAAEAEPVTPEDRAENNPNNSENT